MTGSEGRVENYHLTKNPIVAPIEDAIRQATTRENSLIDRLLQVIRTMATFTFGKSASCELDSDQVFHLRAARGETLSKEEIVHGVQEKLSNPLSYPPLSQATVPGDQVVVALAEGLPQPVAVLEGVVRALRDAGVEPGRTQVLVMERSWDVEILRNELDQLGASEWQIVTHSFSEETEIALFGVSSEGLPLRLNRVLCDADLVLSIGVASEGREAAFNGIYPGFSDRETRDRLQAPCEEDQEQAQRRNAEIQEAGWMLGLGLVVQVVPGPEESIEEIVAGEPNVVLKEAQKRYHDVWTTTCETLPDLVIATIPGDRSQQTWHNLGRSLATATSLLVEGGSVVVCCEIEDLPGESFEPLAGNQDYLLAERELLRSGGEDSSAALQLCRALDQGSVYLWSRLAPGVVESLGMTPIESELELEKLVQVHDMTTILEEAQRLLPTIQRTTTN